VLSSVASGLRRNLSMTLALVLSSSIALAFVAAAFLASTEIGRFQKIYESKIHVSVYLCTKYSYTTQVSTRQTEAKNHQALRAITCPPNESTSAAQRNQIAARLKADPRVQSVSYVSTREALDNAQKANLPGVDQLHVGDLPDSFTIELHNLKADYQPFAAAFADVQGVDEVHNAFQEIKKVLDIIDGIRIFCVLIALVVLVASVLIIANTIQVAAAQRQEETSIMRLVGASRWMTELPFMLETLVATAVGGVIALALLWAGKEYVLNGIFEVQVNRGIIPNLNANDLLIAGGISIGLGVALAALTAFGTLRLRVKL
jgi:cell division transport system permease protein